jgi:hypothetical protein
MFQKVPIGTVHTLLSSQFTGLSSARVCTSHFLVEYYPSSLCVCVLSGWANQTWRGAHLYNSSYFIHIPPLIFLKNIDMRPWLAPPCYTYTTPWWLVHVSSLVCWRKKKKKEKLSAHSPSLMHPVLIDYFVKKLLRSRIQWMMCICTLCT